MQYRNLLGYFRKYISGSYPHQEITNIEEIDVESIKEKKRKEKQKNIIKNNGKSSSLY
jgi:hypothetical protein